jgi:hypothetical protein
MLVGACRLEGGQSVSLEPPGSPATNTTSTLPAGNEGQTTESQLHRGSPPDIDCYSREGGPEEGFWGRTRQVARPDGVTAQATDLLREV